MDKARETTDKELNKLEREIYELYATSQVEISEKWREYMGSHKESLDKLYGELQDAKKSGDKDAITEAQEKYERAVKNVTINDARYKAMINETTAKMANINQTALDYVNKDMPKIYTLNYNAFGDQDIDGYTFALVNERAVANLAMSDKIELPKKKIDVPKDKAWNAKNINSQLIQGILQGENIDKISKRLQNVTDMNKASAIRNARTMVTGAENKGCQDSFEKAQSDGVIMKRKWISTHDERTRAWHFDLDGVEVDVDEPWANEYGEIMYPGDPSADPCNVYNCRCSMRAVVTGFAWDQTEEVQEETPDISEQQPEFNVVQGQDISNTWERRPDEFDFEIEDVINAQGFDGLPRVVSADEFDKYVKESNIVMQRAYNAPNQEILDDYKKQLYEGKWYVDCSKGGASYGQGMYAMANYEGKIDERMNMFMNHYEQRFNKEGVSTVETFTLTPDAKLISYDDLLYYRDHGGVEGAMVRGHIKEMLEEKDSEYTDGMVKCVTAMYNPKYEDFSEAMGAYSNLTKEQRTIVENVTSEIKNSGYKPISNDDSDNVSTIAVLMGYDGITTREEIGEAVILNRTKVIFKGE